MFSISLRPAALSSGQGSGGTGGEVCLCESSFHLWRWCTADHSRQLETVKKSYEGRLQDLSKSNVKAKSVVQGFEKEIGKLQEQLKAAGRVQQQFRAAESRWEER